MSENKDSLIMVATLSEKTRRYDDMAKAMKELVENRNHKISEEERSLVSVSYKNVVGSRRSAWRVVSSIEEKLEDDDVTVAMTKNYKMKIETELTDLCEEVLGLLDQVLIKHDTTDDSKVFYLKMKGDYFGYTAEVKIGSEKEDVVTKAEDAYSDAMVIATDKLPSYDPNRLRLALNFSVFYYEIKKTPESAKHLAQRAVDDAISELDDRVLPNDSTCIMQLLRDNLTLWTSEEQEEEENN